MSPVGPSPRWAARERLVLLLPSRVCAQLVLTASPLPTPSLLAPFWGPWCGERPFTALFGLYTNPVEKRDRFGRSGTHPGCWGARHSVTVTRTDTSAVVCRTPPPQAHLMHCEIP